VPQANKAKAAGTRRTCTSRLVSSQASRTVTEALRAAGMVSTKLSPGFQAEPSPSPPTTTYL
jgi:hypothetical protein